MSHCSKTNTLHVPCSKLDFNVLFLGLMGYSSIFDVV
jgi:hypothetical protein